MMRLAAAIAAVLALAACTGLAPSGPGSHSGVSTWDRHPPASTAEAHKVQQTTARQAKEARCKSEVSPRPGRDGTDSRDYKCKESKFS
jgi:hypothetical protein